MIEEVRLPEISENVESGDVIQVLVKVGDYVEKEQSIAELETEKAAFEVPSPVKGKVTEVNMKEGDKVKVNQVIIKVDTEAKEGEQPKEPEPKKAGKKETPRPAKEKKQSVVKNIEMPKESEEFAEKSSIEPVPAAPSVRQLARELGIDIHKVAGSEEGGRISPDDVKEYARSLISGQASQPTQSRSKPLPDFSKWGEIEREQITVTRRKISETLSYTWSNVPQVTQYDQADITNLEESRKLYLKKSVDNNSKLTITSIALKVAAMALKEFPKFNSSFDAEKNEIIYKKYFHVSVAVETDRGLLAPVIRDVDKKSIVQLAQELNSLAEKTRQHKVTPDEMVGGNFTISNLGGIGGTNFAPIIYWPQVAILGISRAAHQLCYENGAFEPRLILPLSLSYDHRIIDGAEGLIFIRWIAQHLENPLLLTLDEKI
jgi:pyruvate dehydrogenase E2 component (dihydrolipoamide acetyltransferase)